LGFLSIFHFDILIGMMFDEQPRNKGPSILIAFFHFEISGKNVIDEQ